MAHQDYVSRARSNSKKNSPYKGKQPQVNTGISLKQKLIALLTFAAIAVFVGFLWSIKDQQTTPVLTTVNTSATNAQASGLPKPPKEKWSYMEDLKNKEVTEGHYEIEEKGPYKMQCGSFKTKAQADSLKAKIAFVGMEAQVHESQGKNGLWYKVVLGPYERKRLAEKDKHQLKNNQINYCQIWLWQ